MFGVSHTPYVQYYTYEGLSRTKLYFCNIRTRMFIFRMFISNKSSHWCKNNVKTNKNGRKEDPPPKSGSGLNNCRKVQTFACRLSQPLFTTKFCGTNKLQSNQPCLTPTLPHRRLREIYPKRAKRLQFRTSTYRATLIGGAFFQHTKKFSPELPFKIIAPVCTQPQRLAHRINICYFCKRHIDCCGKLHYNNAYLNYFRRKT